MPDEVKLLPCDRAIANALADLKFGMAFAYEQGLHEFGYDPVETVRAAIEASGRQSLSDRIDVLTRALEFLLKNVNAASLVRNQLGIEARAKARAALHQEGIAK